MNIKQRKITIEPRIKLNYSIHIENIYTFFDVLIDKTRGYFERRVIF